LLKKNPCDKRTPDEREKGDVIGGVQVTQGKEKYQTLGDSTPEVLQGNVQDGAKKRPIGEKGSSPKGTSRKGGMTRRLR